MKKIKPLFAAAKKDTMLELLVYEQIGEDWYGDGVSAANVAAAMKEAGSFDSISVRINSPGGSAFEGVAIANLLRAQGKPVNVFVDGIAASAASIIAMAGDKISMGQGAMLMIHNAWTVAMGDGAEMRKTADTLDRISASIASTYADRTGKPLAEIQTLMDAETWLSAEDSVKEGFADELITRSEDEQNKARALAGSFNLSRFKTPASFKEEIAAATSAAEEIPSEQPPADVQPPDWEGQLSVLRMRLELAGE